MQLPPSTVKIAAYIVLNESVTKEWVNWAMEMLEAGYDTNELRMLAGEYAPFDKEEVVPMVKKIFNNFHIDYLDEAKVIDGYIYYLISSTADNPHSRRRTLDELFQLSFTHLHLPTVREFYELDCKLDTWGYFISAEEPKDSRTEDEVIKDYFVEWMKRFEG